MCFKQRTKAKDIRITIGSPDNWTIPLAQEKARELQRLIDDGKDPRSLKADALAETQAQAAADTAKAQQDAAQAVTVGKPTLKPAAPVGGLCTWQTISA